MCLFSFQLLAFCHSFQESGNDRFLSLKPIFTRERRSSSPIGGGPVTVICAILCRRTLFVSLLELCGMPKKSQTTPSCALVYVSSHTSFFSVSIRPPRHCKHLASPELEATVIAEHTLHSMGLIALTCCMIRGERQNKSSSHNDMSIPFWHACVP